VSSFKCGISRKLLQVRVDPVESVVGWIKLFAEWWMGRMRIGSGP